MILDDAILEGLKKRYPQLHPLIFQRSAEKAETPGELFDILENFNGNYPVFWDDESRSWKKTKDIYLHRKFRIK